MSADGVLVLAPEARFLEAGGWAQFPKGLPARPAAQVAHILRSVPALRHDGNTFWGDDLPEFEVDDSCHLLFPMHGGHAGARLELSIVCLALAEKLGPLTLFSAGSDARMPIDQETSGEEILEFLG